MKFAVVAGGWHWPAHFYREIAAQTIQADLFVVAHRNPELPIVREEKREILLTATGKLADLDRELYREYPSISELQSLGWQYQEAPNLCGDWCFFNQWLETHDYKAYDAILNCHDDTFIRSRELLEVAAAWWEDCDLSWLLLGNGRWPDAPQAYVRGSFEFWRREMLNLVGGRIDLGTVNLTREGKTDSPAAFEALIDWNNTGVPIRQFLNDRNLSNRVAYLSETYRISKWAIEAERGFLHFMNGAPWSVEAGLKALS